MKSIETPINLKKENVFKMFMIRLRFTQLKNCVFFEKVHRGSSETLSISNTLQWITKKSV